MILCQSGPLFAAADRKDADHDPAAVDAVSARPADSLPGPVVAGWRVWMLNGSGWVVPPTGHVAADVYAALGSQLHICQVDLGVDGLRRPAAGVRAYCERVLIRGRP